MRLLFVSRFLPYVGGRETFLYNLLTELKKHHEIGLISPDASNIAGVKLYKFSEKESDLEKIFSDFQPDVVNSHTYYLSPPILKLAKKRKVPFITTPHSNPFLIADDKFQHLFKSIISDSDYVISVSKDGRDTIFKEMEHIDKSKFEVLYNGIDLKKFNRDELSSTKIKFHLRDIYGYPLNKFIFTSPIRMSWYKGGKFLVDTVMDNVEDLRRHNVHFNIVTPASRFKDDELEYMKDLQQEIANKNANDIISISFSNYDFMPVMYRISDALILPSAIEQFPISILEAMASMLPVIATRVGGVPELIKDEINGMLVMYENSQELCKSIKRVATDEKFAEILSVNARNDVIENYNIIDVAKKYERIFSKFQNG